MSAGGVDGASQSVVVLLALLGTVEGLVVRDKHVDGDPGHVESVQRVLDGRVEAILVVDIQLPLIPQVVEGVCHPGDRVLQK